MDSLQVWGRPLAVAGFHCDSWQPVFFCKWVFLYLKRFRPRIVFLQSSKQSCLNCSDPLSKCCWFVSGSGPFADHRSRNLATVSTQGLRIIWIPQEAGKAILRRRESRFMKPPPPPKRSRGPTAGFGDEPLDISMPALLNTQLRTVKEPAPFLPE